MTKTVSPLDAFVGVPGKRKIMVFFGTSAMWSIPLDECQTWFVSCDELDLLASLQCYLSSVPSGPSD